MSSNQPGKFREGQIERNGIRKINKQTNKGIDKQHFPKEDLPPTGQRQEAGKGGGGEDWKMMTMTTMIFIGTIYSLGIALWRRKLDNKRK
jgi:hypothetical protein